MNNFIQVLEHVISSDKCAYYINLIENSKQYSGNIDYEKGRHTSPTSKCYSKVSISNGNYIVRTFLKIR